MGKIKSRFDLNTDLTHFTIRFELRAILFEKLRFYLNQYERSDKVFETMALTLTGFEDNFRSS